jgi:hypothetical protein
MGAGLTSTGCSIARVRCGVCVEASGACMCSVCCWGWVTTSGSESLKGSTKGCTGAVTAAGTGGAVVWLLGFGGLPRLVGEALVTCFIGEALATCCAALQTCGLVEGKTALRGRALLAVGLCRGRDVGRDAAVCMLEEGLQQVTQVEEA